MMTRALFLFMLLLGFPAVTSAQSLAPLAIAVFNSNIPESGELARFYAQKRGLAKDHVIGLDCSAEEEISREEYDRTIAEPLRKIFTERKWWNLRETSEGRTALSRKSIHFVALIKGMPLKIRAAENYPGDKPTSPPIGNRNEASVDSELSTLAYFRSEISGAVINAYFQSYRPVTDGTTPLLLVCRLDAPTAETVRQMITDAVETEKTGLWGRGFVDGAHNTGGGLEMGDKWLSETVQQLRKSGVPVVFEDTPAVFPEGYPISDCALYYGWYAGDAAGPFADPLFRFTPGAVAVHIHSFSADTLRNPNAKWVGPLLTRGAAATLGNVYEPYLQLTPHLNVFNDRLLHGFTFAESAYMAMHTVSWMGVAVGDPLYRPYAAWLQFDAKSDPAKVGSEWRMYRDFAVKNSSLSEAEYRNLARQAASRAKNGAMIEDLGLMEFEAGNFAVATGYFQQARATYSKREDILRSVIEEVDAWRKQDQPKRAADVIRPVLKIVSDGRTANLLKKMEQELSTPPGLPGPKQ